MLPGNINKVKTKVKSLVRPTLDMRPALISGFSNTTEPVGEAATTIQEWSWCTAEPHHMISSLKVLIYEPE